MNVKVLYFAQLRERFGVDSADVSLGAGGSVTSLMSALFPDENERERMFGYVQPAVNQKVVPYDTLLSEGDEVALITPVAGG